MSAEFEQPQLKVNYGVEVKGNRYGKENTFAVEQFPLTHPTLAPHPYIYEPDGRARPDDIAAQILGADLSHLTFEQTLVFFDQAVKKQLAAVEQAEKSLENPDQLSSEDLKYHADSLQKHDLFLRNCATQEDIIRAFVENPENYDANAPEIIARRKQKAAELTDTYYTEEVGEYYAKEHGIPVEEARNFTEIVFLNMLSDGEERITDIDDTVTANANHYLREIVPGGAAAERMIDERKNTAEAIKRTFSQTRLGMLVHSPEIFRWAARHTDVKTREGADHYFRSSEKITVISASFLPFVLGVLDKLPSVHNGDVDVHVYAVSPEYVFSMQKDCIVSHIAKLNPTHVTKFKGDGSSDFVVTNSSEVDYIWALRGSSLHKNLTNNKNRHIPYLTYTSQDNSADVENAIKEEVRILKSIVFHSSNISDTRQ